MSSIKNEEQQSMKQKELKYWKLCTLNAFIVIILNIILMVFLSFYMPNINKIVVYLLMVICGLIFALPLGLSAVLSKCFPINRINYYGIIIFRINPNAKVKYDSAAIRIGVIYLILGLISSLFGVVKILLIIFQK